nr:hypothetical protein [Paucibacter aquatile]
MHTTALWMAGGLFSFVCLEVHSNLKIAFCFAFDLLPYSHEWSKNSGFHLYCICVEDQTIEEKQFQRIIYRRWMPTNKTRQVRGRKDEWLWQTGESGR